MMLLASLVLAGCLSAAPGAEHILVQDLVPGFPELATAPPDTPVGIEPAPGVARTFHLSDLRALAARLGVSGEPAHEICIVRPVAPLDPARILAAMQQQLPDAQLEIVDFSRQPVPQGELEFPLTALHYASPESLWTGSVRYGQNRRFTLWARVRIVCRVPRVVAVGDLKAGQPIGATQVMMQVREGLPTPGVFAASLAEVEGKAPRVAIRAGSEIRIALLAEPVAIARGDSVRVQVYSGAARLDLEAQAQTSGAVGQTVVLRNPDSQKQFRAIVEAKDRARVVAPGQVNP